MRQRVHRPERAATTCAASRRAEARELSVLLFACVALMLACAALAGCGPTTTVEPVSEAAAAEKPADIAWPEDDKTAFPVPPPPFTSPDVFPCSGCHDKTLPPDFRRREVGGAHREGELGAIVFNHDPKHLWCFSCHDANDRDKLHLASGELIDFKESYRLCGQCHGEKYRDWRAGVHGRRTGMWNGEKQYLLCVNCHVSHDPHFKPLKPLPPPNRPKRGT